MTDQTVTLDRSPLAVRRRSEEESPTLIFLRRLRRTRLAPFGALLILLVAVVALLAPLLAPHDPIKVNMSSPLMAPSAANLFGTDDLGRDVFSRVIFGSRVALQVGVISVAIAGVVGVALGLIAGYAGGTWIDSVIMRAMDTLLAFPTLVLALAITAALGPSLENAMLAIGIVGIPTYARLVRGQVLSVREREFVQAARVIGCRDGRILLLHILPNVTAPIIVQASLSVAFAIIAEASLSFLGLGVKPPAPSWGSMLSLGRNYLEMAPWYSITPGVAIFLTVLGFNFLGDGIRDALDPRLHVR